jgi:hypothetical protein
VSVPAHLDAESTQKTVDWLVVRLLTRQRPQVAQDEDLLARAIGRWMPPLIWFFAASEYPLSIAVASERSPC